MTTQSKSAVASVVAVLFAVAAFSIHAADQVKSGGPSDRPARALDADSVKAQGASDKSGRGLEEDAPVKAPNKKRYSRQADNKTSDGNSVKAPNKKKHGRALEGERSAMPRTGRPGNEIDESTVKSQGPSESASRAADKTGK
jgi:hypothetical protein